MARARTKSVEKDGEVPGQGKSRQTVVERAMAELREKVFAAEPGAFLGSEASLMAELKVSRTTLRQIYRVLEQHELLTIRRGSGGGFFASRPDITSVVGVATTWLTLNGAEMSHIYGVTRLLSAEAAALAARSTADKSELAQVLRDMAANVPGSRETRIALADRYLNCKLALAGNPALTLFLKSLYALGYSSTHFRTLRLTEEGGIRLQELRVQIGQAILAGDPEMADLLSRRISDLAKDWRVRRD